MALLTEFMLTAPGTDMALLAFDGELVGGGHRFAADRNGIWDLIRPERWAVLDRFAADYAALRTAEHRQLTPDAVRALPAIDPGHPLADMWRQRAASQRRFVAALAPVAPGACVDIGAGCGWLAAGLARGGWRAAAVDVTVEGGDGLAAALHHDVDLLLVRAEMEALPFGTDSVDLAVFNASLHYASDVTHALHEARRVLRPGGTLVVLDSPVFRDPDSGHAMVRELEASLHESCGLPAARCEGAGFLTEHELAPFAFGRVDAEHSVRRKLHQWLGARRAGREVATRPLLITTIGGRS